LHRALADGPLTEILGDLEAPQLDGRQRQRRDPHRGELHRPAERERRTEELRAEYEADIDILHLASELVIDAVVQPVDLRADLIRRFAAYASRERSWPAKRNPVTPV